LFISESGSNVNHLIDGFFDDFARRLFSRAGMQIELYSGQHTLSQIDEIEEGQACKPSKFQRFRVSEFEAGKSIFSFIRSQRFA
jgi:hypothetical protein